MLRQLGKGAMGHVYQALEHQSQRVVAIKVLAPELAVRRDLVQRFEREAAALARVEHPGVVGILSRGSAAGLHYIVMRFVEGQSLFAVMGAAGTLPPLRALAYTRQLVQALGAAHERGVIHRDLKPENVIVEPYRTKEWVTEERLVIVDFGLAGIIGGEAGPYPNLTRSRTTMGTMNYMAPEQQVDAKHVDHRTDLYAAAVILYEMLTRELPLGRFRLPSEQGAPVPRSVDDCLGRALAKDKDDRYATATEFDAALAALETEIGALMHKRSPHR
jgi:serine/threonine-protein kinase